LRDLAAPQFGAQRAAEHGVERGAERGAVPGGHFLFGFVSERHRIAAAVFLAAAASDSADAADAAVVGEQQQHGLSDGERVPPLDGQWLWLRFPPHFQFDGAAITPTAGAVLSGEPIPAIPCHAVYGQRAVRPLQPRRLPDVLWLRHYGHFRGHLDGVRLYYNLAVFVFVHSLSVLLLRRKSVCVVAMWWRWCCCLL